MENPFENTTAILTCGGGSGRLGYPKEMLRVDGAPLAVRMVERLREAFPAVAVVSNTPAFLEHFLDAPLWKDEFEKAGPLAGLHSGLKHAGTDRCFFLACDMPLVHNGIARRLLERARRSGAPAVLPSAGGQLEPLCGVYSREILPALERHLIEGGDRSVKRFLEKGGFAEVEEFSPADAACFRDVDEPEDLWILEKVFKDVEPLPLKRIPMRSAKGDDDEVVEEWPITVYVNGLRLVTVLSLPQALRELAVGEAAYLGLARRREDVGKIEVDYKARRVSMQLAVTDEQIRNASQALITSTCGAAIYGGQMPLPPEDAVEGSFRVRRGHILECLKSLRARAPIFSRTGGTHQAAFTDGERIRLFFEDIGRHNAVDKIVGSAILSGRDLREGALITTGRLSSEMVVKAARVGVPVLASPSAVTTNAALLAEKHGLTLAGFARGERINLYTRPERVLDA